MTELLSSLSSGIDGIEGIIKALAPLFEAGSSAIEGSSEQK